jgi:hypothetical protein
LDHEWLLSSCIDDYHRQYLLDIIDGGEILEVAMMMIDDNEEYSSF